MSLHIDLTPDVEDRLNQEAARQGLAASEYVRHLIEAALPVKKQTDLARLMESWNAEDSNASEEELEARDRDLEEFKANINANRAATGERPVFK